MGIKLLHRSLPETHKKRESAGQDFERQRRARQPFRRVHLQQYMRKNSALLLMALPGILVLLVFSYLPMAGLVIAFKDYLGYQGIVGSAWVGLGGG